MSITAKYHVGEMVRLNHHPFRVVGHTMTVSATCGCGYHHYDLESPAGVTKKHNVCGAKLKPITMKSTPEKADQVAA